MKLYRTELGPVACLNACYYAVKDIGWNKLMACDDPRSELQARIDAGRAPAIVQSERFLAPIENQEVWAAGVTYLRSREARREESKKAQGGDFYDRVYEAERPELFFKSPGYRVIGPGEKVRIRADSRWNVPEPELTLLISASGKITGYTIGNDMSSRDIEGENPLYLPQAKVYDGSCALGPCILLPDAPLAPETTISIRIVRDGAEIFSGSTPISRIKRELVTLVEYLCREMAFRYGCFLMTGTGVVPPDSFTLRSGDEITITVEQIGTLVNTVA
jgi:2-dehydro-3-deoxy-D-arabinonate dehydratase